jgi:hypothetical protein
LVGWTRLAEARIRGPVFTCGAGDCAGIPGSALDPIPRVSDIQQQVVLAVSKFNVVSNSPLINGVFVL